MTWTTFTFSVGQVLSAANMNNLYANFAAMAAGDSGAPSIVEAALDATVAAQLVTNGDTHDHVGGDGGTVQLSSLGTASPTRSSQSVSGSGGTYTLPAGLWNISFNHNLFMSVEINIGGTWYGMHEASSTTGGVGDDAGGFVVSDGTNARVVNDGGGAASFYYHLWT